MAPTPYRCPHCGTVYDVSPKWCRCRPYPVAEPSTTYWIARVDGAPPDHAPIEDGFGGLPDPEVLVDRRVVHRDSGPMYELPDHQPPQHPPADASIQQWIDWYVRERPRRNRARGSTTGFVIGIESEHCGVETAAEIVCVVVDLTAAQYAHLRSLAESSDLS